MSEYYTVSIESFGGKSKTTKKPEGKPDIQVGLSKCPSKGKSEAD